MTVDVQHLAELVEQYDRHDHQDMTDFAELVEEIVETARPLLDPKTGGGLEELAKVHDELVELAIQMQELGRQANALMARTSLTVLKIAEKVKKPDDG